MGAVWSKGCSKKAALRCPPFLLTAKRSKVPEVKGGRLGTGFQLSVVSTRLRSLLGEKLVGACADIRVGAGLHHILPICRLNVYCRQRKGIMTPVPALLSLFVCARFVELVGFMGPGSVPSVENGLHVSRPDDSICKLIIRIPFDES